jgi:hypothetical protein
MANLLDPGTYRARSVEGALGQTSKGKEQVAVKFDLLDFPGQSITWFGFFTEATTNSTFKALRTAGWKGTDLSELSDLSNPDAPEVYLVIEHETYEGKKTAKVRWVNSAGGLALKARLEPEQAKAFAARMRDQLAAFDAASKQNGGTPARAAQRRAEDDGPPLSELDRQAAEQGGGGGPDDIPFAPFPNW